MSLALWLEALIVCPEDLAMKIALVADRNTATCFKLAGLGDVFPAKNAEEAEKLVGELSEDPDVAIILITERLFEQVYGAVETITERKHLVVVPISDRSGHITVKTDIVVEREI